MDPNDHNGQNPGTPPDDGMGQQPPADDNPAAPAPGPADAPSGGMEEVPPPPPVAEDNPAAPDGDGSTPADPNPAA